MIQFGGQRFNVRQLYLLRPQEPTRQDSCLGPDRPHQLHPRLQSPYLLSNFILSTIPLAPPFTLADFALLGVRSWRRGRDFSDFLLLLVFFFWTMLLPVAGGLLGLSPVKSDYSLLKIVLVEDFQFSFARAGSAGQLLVGVRGGSGKMEQAELAQLGERNACLVQVRLFPLTGRCAF